MPMRFSRALILGLLAMTRGQSQAAEPPSSGETRSLLAAFDALPDLTALARARSPAGAHALEKRLARDFRRPHKVWDAYRNPPAPCSTGEHRVPAIHYELAGARGAGIELSRRQLHEVRVHGARFPPEVAAFLRQAAPRYQLFPQDVAPEVIPIEEALKWRAPPDLLFSVAEAWVAQGHVWATGILQNPTASPVVVVYFPTGFANPLTIEVEGEGIARRPVQRSGPPVPPRPPPPARVSIAPFGTVLFTPERKLSEYDYKGAPAATVRWQFHYWNDPRPAGEWPVTLPPR